MGLIMLIMSTHHQDLDMRSIDIQSLFSDLDKLCAMGKVHEEFYKLVRDMMNLDPKKRLSLLAAEKRMRTAERHIIEGQESSDEEV